MDRTLIFLALLFACGCAPLTGGYRRSKVEEWQAGFPLHAASQTADMRYFSRHQITASQARAKDSNGKLPIHYAVDNGDRFVLGILLGAGSPKNPPDANGMTPLDIAIRNTTKPVGTPAPPEYYVDRHHLVTLLRQLGFKESDKGAPNQQVDGTRP